MLVEPANGGYSDGRHYLVQIVSSNRDTAEWLAMFDDVLLARSAVDRFGVGRSRAARRAS